MYWWCLIQPPLPGIWIATRLQCSTYISFDYTFIFTCLADIKTLIDLNDRIISHLVLLFGKYMLCTHWLHKRLDNNSEACYFV